MIDQVIEKYYPRVYAFALVHVKSEAMAKDLTQDVFLQLIKRRSRLSEIDNLESYIFSMTRNAIYRNYRKIQQNQDLKSQMLRSMSDLQMDSSQQVESREMEHFLYEMVDQLPDRQKEIFHLSREKGLTHKEIAEKLNISPNTVKNHMIQALKTLRSRFELLKTGLILVAFWFM